MSEKFEQHPTEDVPEELIMAPTPEAALPTVEDAANADTADADPVATDEVASSGQTDLVEDGSAGSQTSQTVQEAAMLLAAAALGAVTPVYRGRVISQLWNWFVPDVVKGARTISPNEAIGLSLVASILTRRPPRLSDLTKFKVEHTALTPNPRQALAAAAAPLLQMSLFHLAGYLTKRAVRRGR